MHLDCDSPVVGFLEEHFSFARTTLQQLTWPPAQGYSQR
jgi:hypothetical protein